MIKARPAVALLLVLTLSACSVPSMAPQPPAGWSETQTLKRRLTLEPFDDTQPERTLLTVTRLTPEGMRVVVTTPTGQRLMTLERDADGARYTQSLMDPPFPAGWFAQRLEWSLRSEAELARAFAGSEWRVEQQHFEHGPVRRIYQGDTLRARIDGFRDGRKVLTDFQFGFRMVIAPFGETSAS
ncbi:DUF3261 domain-containing protein [Kushneria aurantia]|uniref:DUF3261 domain-containing protein n=1 Tax=Kushneria aurantia TaxID=504092 RepID=A0ABV6FZ66_9GAMM|nr:DUF3261 domain-containing protein [Kushneria aurantia]